MLKDFIRIDVDVYIVSCDGELLLHNFLQLVRTHAPWTWLPTYNNVPVSTVYILEKMHGCMFFDEEIQTSMFFPTLHDAMLHVLEKKGSVNKQWVVRKTPQLILHMQC